MIPPDFFTRIPPASALLVFATLFSPSTTAAHALPRQTMTIPYHELNVRSWPLEVPMPTAATALDDLLQPRQVNTVCGYVGGDPDLPATCSAGSHCVVDTDHGAIGCCPDGGPCTAGVFTDCVDANSGPQTERNPYVHTCSGSDVCYQNQFGGGLFQYGCGSASDLAATVAPTASGKEDVDLTSLSVALTEEPTSLSEPTTLGTRTTTRSSSETTETSETTEASSETESGTSATESASETETDSSSTAGPTTTGSDEMEGGNGDQDEDLNGGDAPSNGGNDTPTGPIVGGTIGGIAFLALTITLGLFLWRRKKGNTREGPGNGPDREYISSPMTDGRHPFSPLHAVPEADETRIAPDPPRVVSAWPTINTESQYSQDHQQHHHHPNMTTSAYYSSDSSGDAFGGAAAGSMDQDRTPLTAEMPRFQSEEYHSGYGGESSRAGPMDPTPAASIGTAVSGHPHQDDFYDQYPGPRRGGGSGALWQQNRKQNRNLTWM